MQILDQQSLKTVQAHNYSHFVKTITYCTYQHGHGEKTMVEFYRCDLVSFFIYKMEYVPVELLVIGQTWSPSL